MKPTSDFLFQYIKKDKKHKYYKQSCKFAEDMLIHYDGKKPGKLLSERRPNESKEIQAFRDLVFESKTKAYCDKINNNLNKIRKSQDWMIKYPGESPTKIAKGETLQDYMEKNFPKYSSFTNWYFQVAFKIYQTDDNGYCLWVPLNEEVGDNEYYKPYPTIYKSHNVIDYKYGEWYLFKSDEKSVFVEKGTEHEGWIYVYADVEGIYTIRQTSADGSYTVEEFEHNLGYIPVVDFGGVVYEESLYQTLRQSRVQGIVPSFNEAVREYSDLQAEIIQHLHSTMWAHEGEDCKKCKGAGEIPKKNSEPITCPSCKGKGTTPFNPYEYFTIRKGRGGEAPISGDPIGYVKKQTEIAVLQNTRIKDHIKDGLSAVNMEFLIDPPQLVESGRAKEVDRDDLNTFYHAVAEDIVRFFDSSYSLVVDYRYTGVVPNSEERKTLLPSIPVPEKYDIFSEAYMIRELKVLKESKVEPEIITAALADFTNKKFFADPQKAAAINCTLDLDPFASQDDEVISLQLTNGGITETDYVIHCNISQFVTRAINEDDKFLSSDFEKKRKVMEKRS